MNIFRESFPTAVDRRLGFSGAVLCSLPASIGILFLPIKTKTY